METKFLKLWSQRKRVVKARIEATALKIKGKARKEEPSK